MDKYTDNTGLVNELKTCKKYIDQDLKKRDWLTKYVKEQVDPVNSNFKKKEYSYFKENTFDNNEFIDYILLDEDYTVLAIIEYKKYSINEEEGRTRAKTYIETIEEQLNYKIPYFLTNGRIWSLIDEDKVERKVSGPFSQDDL